MKAKGKRSKGRVGGISPSWRERDTQTEREKCETDEFREPIDTLIERGTERGIERGGISEPVAHSITSGCCMMQFLCFPLVMFTLD